MEERRFLTTHISTLHQNQQHRIHILIRKVFTNIFFCWPVLVWITVTEMKNLAYEETGVIFEDIKLLRATNITNDVETTFSVSIKVSTGEFELCEGGAAIFTGRVHIPDDISEYLLEDIDKVVKNYPIVSKDFYRELRTRGYNYRDLFRGVTGVNVEEQAGLVHWQNNWVSFMDTMLQIPIVFEDTRGLFIPTAIKQVCIDPRKHIEFVKSFEDQKNIPVFVDKDTRIIKSGGIEIRGLNIMAIAKRKDAIPIIEEHVFVPNNCLEQKYSLEEIIRIMLQFIMENSLVMVVKVAEIASKQRLIAPIASRIYEDIALLQAEITVLTSKNCPVTDKLQGIKIEEKNISEHSGASIVIANNVLQNEQELTHCLKAIKDGGYLITREPMGIEPQINNCCIVMSYVLEEKQIFLLKKHKVETEKNEVITVTYNNFDWIQKGQEAMRDSSITKVYFVTQNEPLNGLLGFINGLRVEPGGTKARCVCIFDNNVPKFSIDDPFYSSQLSKNIAVNIYKNGQWGTYRHLLIDTKRTVECDNIFANTTTRGDLSSLTWMQSSCQQFLDQEEKKDLIQIEYAAVNFKDVMLATGKISPEAAANGRLAQDCVIGFEFSGILRGKKVMGLALQKGLASHTKPISSLIWDVPDSWTLEEAATVPAVYSTVIMALKRAKIQKGESILIHAGAGGVGIAAINLALHYNCVVFTTVGSLEKRNYLLKTFPQLSERNIGNSRSTSFEQLIMRETKGRGVDMVLNSLAGDKLSASTRCLAKNGRFIEIGKYDLQIDSPLAMELFKNGISYFGVMLDAYMSENEDSVREMTNMNEILKQHIESGSVKPLKTTIFPRDELESAFRFMATGKHIGKVLIGINRTSQDGMERDKAIQDSIYKCKPKYFCHPDCTYVVIGGLGGFGLELADWLVLRGAKQIVLSSRKSVLTGYQEYRINLWKSYGVNVLVSSRNVTEESEVNALLEEAEALGPVKAIFQLAVVLKDAIFENQNAETFKASSDPKAKATINLDKCSRKLCHQLEHFVVFSSVSCGRGNPGQTNYAFSNSIMERLCEIRKADGLPALAIQWGAIGQVGLVVEMQDGLERAISGTLQQNLSSCFNTLEQFLFSSATVVSSIVLDEKLSSDSDNIVEIVANIMGIKDADSVPPNSTLIELGMDSIMAVEIKQALERNMEMNLTADNLRGLTFGKLKELAEKQVEGEDSTATFNSEDTNEESSRADYLIQWSGFSQDDNNPIVNCKQSSDKSPNNQVFVFPAIEGNALGVKPLTDNLESNVYCLQFDNNNTDQSYKAITKRLLPHVIQQLGTSTTFNLVGYSYGGIVCLLVAHELEKLGLRGKICMVDSSPYMLKTWADMFDSSNDEKGQLVLIGKFLEGFHGSKSGTISEIAEQAEKISGWEPKVDFVVDNLNLGLTMSKESLKNKMMAGQERIKGLDSFEAVPDKSLNSTCILIKSTKIYVPGPEDYGLSKLFKLPVQVYTVEGSHVTMLTEARTAYLINSLFGFKSKPSQALEK